MQGTYPNFHSSRLPSGVNRTRFQLAFNSLIQQLEIFPMTRSRSLYPAHWYQPTPLTLEQLESRMLMAFDALETQIDHAIASEIATPEASAIQQPETENSVGNTNQTLAAISVLRSNGSAITAGERVSQTSNSLQLRVVGLNSQGQVLSTAPRASWIISSTDRTARATVRVSSSTTTISFNRPADYQIVVRSGQLTARFSVRVVAPARSIAVFNSNNARLVENALVTTTGVSHTFSVIGYSASNQTTTLLQASQWSVVSSPNGSSPTFQSQGNRTTVHFDRAGLYTLRVSNGSLTSRVRVQVNATLRSLSIEPNSNSLETGESRQFTAVARDQFQQPLAQQPTITWTATGGSISSGGLYQAGTNPGNFQVTARVGSISTTASVTLSSPLPDNPQGDTTIVGINDSNLDQLFQTFYADGSIDRNEMMQLLRSAANDGILSATELADFRWIVAADSNVQMPDHVRGLARNVVHNNPANLKFQGQNAGNLTAGSSGQLLNNLVDKWFLGVDLPALTSSSISYRYAVGTLFNGAPTMADSRQGMLGDCYFLASLVSIAQINPTAIHNMFTDNGDGTFTIRFYHGNLGLFWQGDLISAGFLSGSGVADYVTVTRDLPTLSNGGLAYSGYGRSALNTSTPLWLALAEKAYAQWNETGRSGRNGTNTFSGIEGGWMSNVNAQVLGYNSTHHVVNSGSKQPLVNALSAGRAVTIGTNPSATTGGLVGSHAYIVTGYNASTDTFSFYNPWGTQHPTPLTWTQLQGQTSAYVIADPSGSVASGGFHVHTANRLAATPLDKAVALHPVKPSVECIDRLLENIASQEATMDDLWTGLAGGLAASKSSATSDWSTPAKPFSPTSDDATSIGERLDSLESLIDSLVEVS